jgi:CBS domain-containing protein
MADVDRIPEGLITETKFFDAKTPITKIIPAVQDHTAVIINKGGEYFGIIDSRIIYRYLQDLRVSKSQSADKFVARVPRITDSTSIDDVIYYFYKSGSKALPYVKNHKITGVLMRKTLLKVLLSLDRLGDTKVAEAMSSPVIGIDINATVAQAKNAMQQNKINRIAVLDDNRFVGIVTNYDLINKYLISQERLPERKSSTYNQSNIKLDSIVERNSKTMDQKLSIKDAVREMVENNVSSLVVTKGNKPVGILTELDIILGAMASGGAESNKIFLSGLDADTYQYEDEVRDMLKDFLAKMERLSRIKVEYMSVVVKKFRSQSYEIHARLSLGKQGIISSHITGHIFDRTMSDLLGRLSKEVKNRKERYLTIRNVLHGSHPDDEME